jgi:3'-5' exoribonuclease
VREHHIDLATAALQLRIDVRPLALYVISHPQFQTAAGGASHHHHWRHGLHQHTAEVVGHVLRLAEGKQDRLDMDALVTAAIWHDFCKIREYAFGEDGSVIKLPYRKLIGHVSGSYVEFVCHARLLGLPQERIETIGHIMLAHHGKLEWRSPVTPQNEEARILHEADMLSARGPQ